jgi:hypothetical protein
MTWATDDTFFVALAGNGGTNPAVGEFMPPAGPKTDSRPAAVVASISPGECPVAVATNLSSPLDPLDPVIGVSDVAILGSQLQALVAGGTAAMAIQTIRPLMSAWSSRS